MDIRFDQNEFSDYLLHTTKHARTHLYSQIQFLCGNIKTALTQLGGKTEVKLKRLSKEEIIAESKCNYVNISATNELQVPNDNNSNCVNSENQLKTLVTFSDGVKVTPFNSNSSSSNLKKEEITNTIMSSNILRMYRKDNSGFYEIDKRNYTVPSTTMTPPPSTTTSCPDSEQKSLKRKYKCTKTLEDLFGKDSDDSVIEKKKRLLEKEDLKTPARRLTRSESVDQNHNRIHSTEKPGLKRCKSEIRLNFISTAQDAEEIQKLKLIEINKTPEPSVCNKPHPPVRRSVRSKSLSEFNAMVLKPRIKSGNSPYILFGDILKKYKQNDNTTLTKTDDDKNVISETIVTENSFVTLNAEPNNNNTKCLDENLVNESNCKDVENHNRNELELESKTNTVPSSVIKRRQSIHEEQSETKTENVLARESSVIRRLSSDSLENSKSDQIPSKKPRTENENAIPEDSNDDKPVDLCRKTTKSDTTKTSDDLAKSPLDLRVIRPWDHGLRNNNKKKLTKVIPPIKIKVNPMNFDTTKNDHISSETYNGKNVDEISKVPIENQSNTINSSENISKNPVVDQICETTVQNKKTTDTTVLVDVIDLEGPDFEESSISMLGKGTNSPELLSTKQAAEKLQEYFLVLLINYNRFTKLTKEISQLSVQRDQEMQLITEFTSKSQIVHYRNLYNAMISIHVDSFDVDVFFDVLIKISKESYQDFRTIDDDSFRIIFYHSLELLKKHFDQVEGKTLLYNCFLDNGISYLDLMDLRNIQDVDIYQNLNQLNSYLTKNTPKPDEPASNLIVARRTSATSFEIRFDGQKQNEDQTNTATTENNSNNDKNDKDLQKVDDRSQLRQLLSHSQLEELSNKQNDAVVANVNKQTEITVYPQNNRLTVVNPQQQVKSITEVQTSNNINVVRNESLSLNVVRLQQGDYSIKNLLMPENKTVAVPSVQALAPTQSTIAQKKDKPKTPEIAAAPIIASAPIIAAAAVAAVNKTAQPVTMPPPVNYQNVPYTHNLIHKIPVVAKKPKPKQAVVNKTAYTVPHYPNTSTTSSAQNMNYVTQNYMYPMYYSGNEYLQNMHNMMELSYKESHLYTKQEMAKYLNDQTYLAEQQMSYQQDLLRRMSSTSVPTTQHQQQYVKYGYHPNSMHPEIRHSSVSANSQTVKTSTSNSSSNRLPMVYNGQQHHQQQQQHQQQQHHQQQHHQQQQQHQQQQHQQQHHQQQQQQHQQQQHQQHSQLQASLVQPAAQQRLPQSQPQPQRQPQPQPKPKPQESYRQQTVPTTVASLPYQTNVSHSAPIGNVYPVAQIHVKQKPVCPIPQKPVGKEVQPPPPSYEKKTGNAHVTRMNLMYPAAVPINNYMSAVQPQHRHHQSVDNREFIDLETWHKNAQHLQIQSLYNTPYYMHNPVGSAPNLNSYVTERQQHLHQQQHMISEKTDILKPTPRNSSRDSGYTSPANNLQHQSDEEIMTCNVCSGPATFVCSGCRTVNYCSIKCQASAWSAHQINCFAKP